MKLSWGIGVDLGMLDYIFICSNNNKYKKYNFENKTYNLKQKEKKLKYHYKKIIKSMFRKRPSWITFESIPVYCKKHNNIKEFAEEQNLNLFFSLLKEKCNKKGVQLRIAKPNFKSSQICSKCQNIDKNMSSLEIRTYHCKKCGTVLDRDLNASINLRDCKEFILMEDIQYYKF